jgi:hypothetical protein
MLAVPVNTCGITSIGPPLEGFGKTMGVELGWGVADGVKVAVGWATVIVAPVTLNPLKPRGCPLLPVAPVPLNWKLPLAPPLKLTVKR